MTGWGRDEGKRNWENRKTYSAAKLERFGGVALHAKGAVGSDDKGRGRLDWRVVDEAGDSGPDSSENLQVSLLPVQKCNFERCGACVVHVSMFVRRRRRVLVICDGGGSSGRDAWVRVCWIGFVLYRTNLDCKGKQEQCKALVSRCLDKWKGWGDAEEDEHSSGDS